MMKKNIFYFFSLFLMLLMSIELRADIVDTFSFQDEASHQRAMALAKELRCPQCQNQNLLESNSPIAMDLRLEVYERVNRGETNEQIIKKMTERFGDFVRYDPPFNRYTLILWLAPFIIFIIVASVFFLFYKYRLTNKNTTDSVAVDDDIALPDSYFSFKVLFGFFIVILSVSAITYFIMPRFGDMRVAEKQQEKTLQQVNQPVSKVQQTYIELIQEDLRKNPNDLNKWLMLAQAYMQAEEFDFALIAYANAEKIAGSTPDILGLAATAYYYQNNQYINPKIQHLLGIALSKNPQEISSLSLLAEIAFKNKEYNKAIEIWEKILDSDNKNIQRRSIIEKIITARFLIEH